MGCSYSSGIDGDSSGVGRLVGLLAATISIETTLQKLYQLPLDFAMPKSVDPVKQTYPA